MLCRTAPAEGADSAASETGTETDTGGAGTDAEADGLDSVELGGAEEGEEAEAEAIVYGENWALPVVRTHAGNGEPGFEDTRTKREKPKASVLIITQMDDFKLFLLFIDF